MQYDGEDNLSFSDDNPFAGGAAPQLRRCRIINAYIEKNNSRLEEVIRDLCLTHLLYPPPVRRGEEAPQRYGITFLDMRDPAYIDEMYNNTYEEEGEPGRAVRAFKNLVLMESFHSPKDFQECLDEQGGNIRTASGWYVTITSVTPEGNVEFDGGMSIKASKFKAEDKALSVWEVVAGAPRTKKEVSYGPKKNSRSVGRLLSSVPKKDKTVLLENVTKSLYESYNVVGLNMLVNVLNKFVGEFNRDKCMTNDTLRTSEVSLANYLYAYDSPDHAEYNKYVGGMRPLNGVGLILKFVDGDKKNFVKMISGSNMNSEKNKDVMGWGYRDIYTSPVIENWMDHYVNGKKTDVFSDSESEKHKKSYSGGAVNDEVIDEIKDIYNGKGVNTLWKDMASHVIAQDLLNIYESTNSSISLDNFENTLLVAKASCNGIRKSNMFELNNKLRSAADMELFKTFVRSSSFVNVKPTLNLTSQTVLVGSKRSEIKSISSTNFSDEDGMGAKITMGRVGYIKEDSNCYLNDYIKAKSGVRGGDCGDEEKHRGGRDRCMTPDEMENESSDDERALGF